MKRDPVLLEQKNLGRIILDKARGTSKGRQMQTKTKRLVLKPPHSLPLHQEALPVMGVTRFRLLCPLVLLFARELKGFGLWGRRGEKGLSVQEALNRRAGGWRHRAEGRPLRRQLPPLLLAKSQPPSQHTVSPGHTPVTGGRSNDPCGAGGPGTGRPSFRRRQPFLPMPCWLSPAESPGARNLAASLKVT